MQDVVPMRLSGYAGPFGETVNFGSEGAAISWLDNMEGDKVGTCYDVVRLREAAIKKMKEVAERVLVCDKGIAESGKELRESRDTWSARAFELQRLIEQYEYERKKLHGDVGMCQQELNRREGLIRCSLRVATRQFDEPIKRYLDEPDIHKLGVWLIKRDFHPFGDVRFRGYLENDIAKFVAFLKYEDLGNQLDEWLKYLTIFDWPFFKQILSGEYPENLEDVHRCQLMKKSAWVLSGHFYSQTADYIKRRVGRAQPYDCLFLVQTRNSYLKDYFESGRLDTFIDYCLGLAPNLSEIVRDEQYHPIMYRWCKYLEAHPKRFLKFQDVLMPFIHHWLKGEVGFDETVLSKFVVEAQNQNPSLFQQWLLYMDKEDPEYCRVIRGAQAKLADPYDEGTYCPPRSLPIAIPGREELPPRPITPPMEFPATSREALLYIESM